MKRFSFSTLLAFLLIIGGCAHEACYIDNEHGLSSNAAFDKQIVNKDYKYADKNVSGMDAIYAETIIGKQAETFSNSMTKETIYIDDLKFKEKQ